MKYETMSEMVNDLISFIRTLPVTKELYRRHFIIIRRKVKKNKSRKKFKKNNWKMDTPGGYTTTPPNGVCVTCDKNTHFLLN